MGNMDMVNLIIENAPSNINCLQLAFVATAKKGDPDICEWLLRHPKRCSTSLHLAAPLDVACVGNHVEVVKLLLADVADIHAWTGSGAAVYNASKNSHTALLKLLLFHGAYPHYRDNDGWTALNFAIDRGCLDSIHLLLEQGVDVNARDESGWPPFHWACKKGDVKILTLLLDYGVDTGLKTLDGLTPLDIAQSGMQLEAIQMLVLQMSEELNLA